MTRALHAIAHWLTRIWTRLLDYLDSDICPYQQPGCRLGHRCIGCFEDRVI